MLGFWVSFPTMLRQTQLVSLLDRVLNQSAKMRLGGAQAVYHCPFCNENKRVPKLEIRILEGSDFQSWHCWICNSSGLSIRSLFRKLHVNQTFFAELYKIVGKSEFRPRIEHEEFQESPELPKEFLSLRDAPKTLEFGNAVSYLRQRGITKDDILRYNMGYCESGEYKHRIIIPSYDKDGNLNFFSARAYYDGATMKYKLPPWSKNIVGFELFINWNEPITLVESPFNAITIRNNAIPLFGKTMSNKLKSALVENKISRVNVCLDKDAEKDSLSMCEYLVDIGIKDVYFVKLTKKDPNEIGFLEMSKLLNQAERMDFQSMMKKRLMII